MDCIRILYINVKVASVGTREQALDRAGLTRLGNQVNRSPIKVLMHL